MGIIGCLQDAHDIDAVVGPVIQPVCFVPFHASCQCQWLMAVTRKGLSSYHLKLVFQNYLFSIADLKLVLFFVFVLYLSYFVNMD